MYTQGSVITDTKGNEVATISSGRAWALEPYLATVGERQRAFSCPNEAAQWVFSITGKRELTFTPSYDV